MDSKLILGDVDVLNIGERDDPFFCRFPQIDHSQSHFLGGIL